MRNQRLVSSVFDCFVLMVRSVSVVHATTPVLALTLAWACLFSLASVRVGFKDSGPELTGWVRSTLSFSQTATLNQHEIAHSVRDSASRLLQLSQPQRLLATFLAKTYRVDVEELALYVQIAYSEGRAQRVDPLLILAIMSIESSFDPGAQSHAGAQGLMQVLTKVHTEKFAPFGGVRAAFDVRANIHVGTRIIREYLQREGSLEQALKSYVGAALLETDGGYGSKVIAQMQRLSAVSLGRPVPPIPQMPAHRSVLAIAEAKGDFAAEQVSGVLGANGAYSTQAGVQGFSQPAAPVESAEPALPQASVAGQGQVMDE